MEPSEKPEPKVAALKDRIADLRLRERAAGAGGKIAEQMKLLRDKAPIAAADLAAKLKSAAEATKLDQLNLERLKAGRDGLAARVEAMLKARPADDGPDDRAKPHAKPAAASTIEPQPAATPVIDRRQGIAAMKARLDAALQPKDGQADPSTVVAARATAISDAIRGAGVSREAGTAEATGTTEIEPKSRWASPFTRSKRAATAVDPVAAPASELPSTETTAIDRDAVVVRPDVSTMRTSVHVERMKPRRSFLTIGMLSTALVTGAVLHILTTFAIPSINSGSAFDRLKYQLDTNAMRVLPVDANGATPAPFLSPDMRYAMCRYDITRGPVQVTAILPDLGWSLALYTPQGDNFYAVPGQDGRVVESIFTINSGSDRLLIPVPGVRRSDTDAANVTSPQREGLVVIRAPNLGTAYQASATAALNAASCRAVERR